ncbi:MAG: TonB dependent receptor [Bacteroidia bacterium]|nr:TonB dependent receptor [Bacteroidia bacterium]
MKINFTTLLLILLLCASAVYGQNGTIKGSVGDTVELKTTAYAQVLLIKPDSILQTYAYVTNSGNFIMKDVPAGSYRLLITRPGFLDYEDFIQLSANQVLDVGFISIISKANFLKEVIIKDKLDAIRIKGDTTEFLVDSFLTNKEASVEELMKRLPCIQVDKNGKITAQGKEVKKVLVDGEEFFGDDPTVATRNLKARQVESIQVFEKKSEQATITGVDDGEGEKTINLKLKEDAKKGYFGKAQLAAGSSQRYEHELMFNKFNKKQKISFYGALSNTNKTGLDWEDSRRFSGDDDNYFMDDDGTTYFYNNQNDGNFFDGVGVPNTWYAGGHYSDKFKSDKHAINFNFSHKEVDVEGENRNTTTFILPDTSYFNSDTELRKNRRAGNNFSLRYDWQIDTLTKLTLQLKASQSNFNNRSTYLSENRNEENVLVNSNNRSLSNEGASGMLTTKLNLSRKFNKKGRVLLWMFNHDYNEYQNDGLLNSTLSFFQTGNELKVNINQLRENNSNGNKLSTTVSFTEPLNKVLFLITDYSLMNNNETNTLFVNERDGNGLYNNRIDSLSNDFRYRVTQQQGGLSLKYQEKKITSSVGMRVSYTDLWQKNLVNDVVQTQLFPNYFPSARFNYKFNSMSNMEISYNGRTRQPTLNQIQPVLNLTDPLQLYIGNTALKQSFTNAYSARYNVYKPLKGNGMWVYASYSETFNDFANKDEVEADGRRIIQTINVNGNYGYYGSIYHYYSIKKLKVSVNNYINHSFNRRVSFVNGLRNINENGSTGFGSSINKSKEDKYDFSLKADFDYNRSVSSIRANAVTGFWLYTYGFNFEYYLPKQFSIAGDIESSIRQRTADFAQNNDVTIINLSLNKRFFKKKNLLAQFEVRDLLNQNLGFSRNIQSNFINENVHTVLRRYFMLRIVYNFNSVDFTKKTKTEEVKP